MNKKTIITCGISGSGKSSWAKQFCIGNPTYLIVNRDSIRNSLIGDNSLTSGYYQRSDLNHIENTVSCLVDHYIHTLINFNYNIIVDATHLKEKYIKSLLKTFEYEDYDVEFKVFDINLDLAKERVYKRDYYHCDDTDEHKIFCINKTLDYIDKQYENFQNLMKSYDSTTNKFNFR